MSQLNELINKTIHAIQFNGCTLPESILRHQIENIVACAQLEESMRSNQRFLDSIGTAFGNGGNDRPNVIGEHITEPSLTPEQMVRGEWYKLSLNLKASEFDWFIKFSEFKHDRIWETKCFHTKGYYNSIAGYFSLKDIESIRSATKEEVLKYYPNEVFN